MEETDMKTKTMIAGIAATAVILTLQTASAFAASPENNTASGCPNHSHACHYADRGCGFIDEDGDGICDNYADRRQNNAPDYGNWGHHNRGHHNQGCRWQ